MFELEELKQKSLAVKQGDPSNWKGFEVKKITFSEYRRLNPPTYINP